MKIIVLVIAIKTDFFDQLKRIWLKYCDSKANVKVYFVYAGDVNAEESDLVFSDIDESLHPGILQKTIRAMEHVSKLDYDYLVRTNLSTFWDFHMLCAKIHEYSRDNVIYGVFRNKRSARNDKFVSGHSMIMNKSTVDNIVSNKDSILSDARIYTNSDDYMLSKHVIAAGGDIERSFNGKIIESLTYVDDDIADMIYKAGKEMSIVNYRVKNKHDRNIDIKLHQLLYEKVYT